MTNGEIARMLRERAAELARNGNNLYRVRAFRQAAMAVLGLPDEVRARVATAGPRALEQVPGIGKSLAGTIAEAVLCSASPNCVHPGVSQRVAGDACHILA